MTKSTIRNKKNYEYKFQLYYEQSTFKINTKLDGNKSFSHIWNNQTALDSTPQNNKIVMRDTRNTVAILDNFIKNIIWHP